MKNETISGVLKISGFELMGAQEQHIKTVAWLIGDCCIGAGRSFTLMIAYIAKAIDRPNMRIIIRDHYPFQDADELLCRKIVLFIKSHFPENVITKLKYGSTWICFNGYINLKQAGE